MHLVGVIVIVLKNLKQYELYSKNCKFYYLRLQFCIKLNKNETMLNNVILSGWMKMCTVAALFIGYQMLIIVILGGGDLLQLYPQLCQVINRSNIQIIQK